MTQNYANHVHRPTMTIVGYLFLLIALAAFVLRNYINDQEQKANPQPADVYMITRDIARGEPFTSANSVGIKKH